MTWLLRPERSLVRVEARAPLHTVRAEGAAVRGGAIAFDPGDLAGSLRLELAIDVAAIRSGDGLLDGKAQAHVESQRHPVARYVLERATGEAHALVLDGAIAWRDRRVPIVTTARVEVSSTEARGRTRFRLDLSRFGLVAPRLLFLKVDDVVEVEVELVAAASR